MVLSTLASNPHYSQSNGFIKSNVHTMKSTLKKAKASKIPMLQSLMKLCQTSTCSNLPSPMEILHNKPAEPCKPGQQELLPIDLQRICEALPDLLMDQDVLYIVSLGN